MKERSVLTREEILNKIIKSKEAIQYREMIKWIMDKILDLIDYEGERELKLMELENDRLMGERVPDIPDCVNCPGNPHVSGGWGRFDPWEVAQGGEQSDDDIPQF